MIAKTLFRLLRHLAVVLVGYFFSREHGAARRTQAREMVADLMNRRRSAAGVIDVQADRVGDAQPETGTLR